MICYTLYLWIILETQSVRRFKKRTIINTLWWKIIMTSLENGNDVTVTLNMHQPWVDARPDNHRWGRNEVHRESLTSRRLVVVVLFNLLAVCPSNIRPCNSPPRTLLISRVPRYVRVCRQTPWLLIILLILLVASSAASRKRDSVPRDLIIVKRPTNLRPGF